MISCRVLGPVSIEVDGTAAPAELLWRKHLALLVYLARSPRRSRTREHLIGLLWPDKEEGAARHSLNEALRVLRRAAGDAAIDAVAGQVRLAEGAVQLDTEVLQSRIAEADWQGAAELIAGEFLEGFAVPDATEFEDWLAAERRHWNEQARVALLGLAEAQLVAGKASASLAAARRAEALDPYSDVVTCAVMSAHVVQGDATAAEACFERFAALLTRDLGRTPAEPTRHLVERIRLARGPRQTPTLGGEDAQPAPRRAPLVGRAAELRRMLGLWEAGRTRRSATALVLEGDSGSGKSRLLEEFLTRARLHGDAAALLRAVEADLQQPGSGLLGLARGGLLDAPGLPGASPHALAAFAALVPEWADRFPARPTEGQLPVARAFAGLVDAVTETAPIVLAVDDAQWIDHESLLTLLGALRDCRARPLCLVFALPPELPRSELDELRRRLGHELPGETLRLGPLDGAALRELSEWALPEYEPLALERITRRVASDSAGLPLLAVELLSAVAQGLDLQQTGASWPEPFRTLTQTLPADLPDSVIAAVRVGFRRLSPAAQRVLGAASVLAQRVTVPQLVRATELDPRVVEAALDELEWQRWLELDGQGYGFVARLVGEIIARDMLTPGQRARYRERAGGLSVT